MVALIVASLIASFFRCLSSFVSAYLFEQTFRFEFFAQGGVEEMFEGHVHEAPRSNQFDDLYLLHES